MSIRIRDEINIRTTLPRSTPPPASERFREALADSAAGLLSGVESVSGFLPGGSALTAAVRGGASASASASAGGGVSPEATGSSAPAGGTMTSALRDNTSQTLQLLELQQQMAMEQRQFTTVSNVMKARHDTAKSVINNVR